MNVVKDRQEGVYKGLAIYLIVISTRGRNLWMNFN